MTRPDDNAVMTEYAVLGGLLLDNSRAAEVDLAPDDFAVSQNREIYTAIQDLLRDGLSADPITVADYLERKNPGRKWLGDVAYLANNTPSAANVVAYATLVRQEALKRRARAVAKTLELSLRESGMEAVDAAIRDLMLLAAPRRDWECTVQQAVLASVDAIDVAYRAGGRLTGITTGLADLDEALGGLHASDLIVIGARPSIGKTSVMLNLADNAGVPVGVISGEQGREQVGLRLVAKNGRLNAARLRTGKVADHEWPRVTAAGAVLKDRPIWLNDRPNPSIDEVMRQARKWAFQHSIQALYVDYIQRIRALPSAPRHEQVGYVALCLKELARELGIPVVALAQVNRNVDDRDNKRPYMGDLKDSGSIEQEADIVMLLYRDDAYDENSQDRGVMEINIAKNRHGPTGMIKCQWDGATMTVNNLAQRAMGAA